MAATARQEHDLKVKYNKLKIDPNLPALERLRAFVLSKGTRSLKQLNSIFKRIDVNKDHKIDFQEFQGALKHEGIFVDQSVERECFDAMDQDRSGVLNFDEFLVALRPPMSNSRKNLIQQAFNKLDKSGDGVVTTEDLKGVYCGKKHQKYLRGEWTEDQVEYEDFELYYCGVSASIDTDAYFDLMMRQAWKL
ncbi:hypothetical protein CAPTEDRAFT_18750 [Capitella teleta]|uniref:EF-hand domain-containing protein n=1 Tax=Capitella teleta TaxID=283909 RepID=R7U713_CAPTE|nr:hypothetical protein CAPTEDRAFT_18750 [Capitella teleta]|eukprot:ELT99456.1 hypothetical protein CAPTEDRAFT_18750 [Capitella teleta]